jgi:predicted MFS family arabinose efflux permease
MSLDGLGWGIATTCLLAMVMLCTPSSISPGVAMGWYIGFQGLAFALATTVGGVLGQAIGIQAAMLTLATLPVIAATLISLRLPPIARAADDAGVANATADANPNAPATGPGAVAAAIRRLGALPAAVWAASLVAVYLNVMNGLLQSFFPLLGLSLGLSVVQIGTLSSIRTGISSVARFGAGWLFHRVRPSRLHLPLLAVSAGTLALLPSAAGYLACAPLFALNGVSRGLLRVTTSASAMEQTPSDRTGAAAAVMTAGLDVGKMLGPLIGGLVAAAIGLDGMFRTVPLAFLVLSVGLLLISARRQAASAARREGPPLLDEPS